jgi:acetyl-CoA carboxylase/biotin carboxylase 1
MCSIQSGVLEAAGAASIKYRDRDIVATAHRIDETLVSLDNQLAHAKASHTPSNMSAVKDLEKQIKARERMLFGVFQQVAVHFADLHDTPGRMRAKGVIKKQIMWSQSRAFFYWRLRRRLHEFQMANEVGRLRGKDACGGADQTKLRLEFGGTVFPA